MEHVFVSYAHKNEKFADRLVTDLTYSDVPATYDKWLLKVGDSIVGKIAASISDASSVIAVLSKASVKSQWVTKELSLAMTSEIASKRVKVLPIVIDKCTIPPMLRDKFYADFRGRYYFGLTQLIASLSPETEQRYRPIYQLWQDVEDKAAELRTIMDAGQSERVREWFGSHPTVLVLLFGRLWAFSDAVSDFAFGRNREVVDYLIANGQSFSYDFQAVKLGPVTWADDTPDEILNVASSLYEYVSDCRKNYDEFRRAACIRFCELGIAPSSLLGGLGDRSRVQKLTATILLGRRDQYGDVENRVRQNVEELSEGLVEVASYDRLLDAIEKSKDRWR